MVCGSVRPKRRFEAIQWPLFAIKTKCVFGAGLPESCRQKCLCHLFDASAACDRVGALANDLAVLNKQIEDPIVLGKCPNLRSFDSRLREELRVHRLDLETWVSLNYPRLPMASWFSEYTSRNPVDVISVQPMSTQGGGRRLYVARPQLVQGPMRAEFVRRGPWAIALRDFAREDLIRLYIRSLGLDRAHEQSLDLDLLLWGVTENGNE